MNTMTPEAQAVLAVVHCITISNPYLNEVDIGPVIPFLFSIGVERCSAQNVSHAKLHRNMHGRMNL